MKYCCKEFEFDAKLPSTTAPNIRIVKFLPHKGWDADKTYLGFLLTLGYEKFSLYMPFKHLKFCPHCGVCLKDFYNNEKYANEIEGKTF